MKKPKKPMVNSSLATWKRYEQRLKEWETKKKLIERLKSR